MKYIGLFLIFIMCMSSFAQSKRRYRQRHNKLQVHFDMSFSKPKDKDGSIGGPFQLSYARNFEMFELGVFLDLYVSDLGLKFKDFAKKVPLSVGVLGQFNFIKNKRKMDMIPSVGIKLGWQTGSNGGALVAPYLSGEYFLSSRTSLGLRIEYPLVVWEFQGPFQGLNTLVNFSYYFH